MRACYDSPKITICHSDPAHFLSISDCSHEVVQFTRVWYRIFVLCILVYALLLCSVGSCDVTNDVPANRRSLRLSETNRKIAGLV